MSDSSSTWDHWGVNIGTRSLAAFGEDNEDHVGYVTRDRQIAAWVIDGATPLVPGGRIYPRSTLDVQWFVQEISTYLHLNSLSDVDPKTLFRRANEAIYGSYCSRAKRANLWEYPLAAISWVRLDLASANAMVEYLCLGDCPLLVASADSLLLEVTGDQKQELLIRDAVGSALRRGLKDGPPRLVESLMRRRETQHTNPPEGIFARNPEGIDRGNQGELSITQPFNLLLATDGLFRLVDLFRSYSPVQFCSHCASDGFDALITELRALEGAPESPRCFPRLKSSDDASGLIVQCAALGSQSGGYRDR